MAPTSTCSRCGGTFAPPSFLTLNLGWKRMVRCPLCHRWTDLNAPAPKESRPMLFEAADNDDEMLRRRIEESRWEELE